MNRALPPDVVRLVIAARGVAYDAHPEAEALRELDEAAEAFADRVAWEGEGGDHASAGWIEWKGGECPVEPDTAIEVRLRDGRIGGVMNANAWCWLQFGGGPDIIAYRLSDRLADERSEPAEPEPCFECGSTERIGTACKPCNPELDPSAIAGAIEKLEKWAARVERDGGWTIVEHPRTLIIGHDAQALRIKALEEENEELRLAICGGEDAPGYAAAQTLETIIGVLESNYVLWRYETERAMDLAGHLTCILPMAKGYVRDNPVGRNAEMIAEAEALLGTEGRDDG